MGSGAYAAKLRGPHDLTTFLGGEGMAIFYPRTTYQRIQRINVSLVSTHVCLSNSAPAKPPDEKREAGQHDQYLQHPRAAVVGSIRRAAFWTVHRIASPSRAAKITVTCHWFRANRARVRCGASEPGPGAPQRWPLLYVIHPPQSNP